MLKKNSNCYNASGSSPTFALVLRPRGLRPPAAAAYLGTTPFAVEELMRSGKLPFRIVGGARVIAVEDLDNYFDSLTSQAGKLAGRGRFLEPEQKAA
jgi:hypothetical protein